MFYAVLFGAACQNPERQSSVEGVDSYLYVWSWDADQKSSDFLAVFDADPLSSNYGELLTTISVGRVGGAHHTEHRMPEGSRFFANSFPNGTTFVMDVSEPASP